MPSNPSAMDESLTASFSTLTRSVGFLGCLTSIPLLHGSSTPTLYSSPLPPHSSLPPCLPQWVCMAEEAGRRYDWVEYENGVQLGNKATCRSESCCLNLALNFINTQTRSRLTRGGVTSSGTAATACASAMRWVAPLLPGLTSLQVGEDSDRYWSLLPATADTATNMVNCQGPQN